ncbi:MAG TPA: hypothetical protein VM032_14130 [Vicinamibacterales bacterium]|nr:hypothetical protein [Vicinamibacterales bacterium]
MSERKYRQRGYQDEPPRDRNRGGAPQGPRKPPEARAPGRQFQDASGPKTPNLMASHEVFKCARCGNKLGLPVGLEDRCHRCGVDVHSCVNCVSFDTGSRWECSQPALAARVSPKDERNPCTWFEARTTIERQTTTQVAPNTARQAFDDLFKI